MIPKLLHYIWLGNEKTPNVLKCIDSFHEYMSDYEITEWNESNIDTSQFTAELKKLYDKSYNDSKFAFCSDIARLYILKQFGGVYVDTDVEFIKHLPDEILNDNFISRINPQKTVCNGCIWGCHKDDRFVTATIRWFDETLKRFPNLYGKRWIYNTIIRQFFEFMGDTFDDTTIVDFFDYKIYPTEYFCPKNLLTNDIVLTPNSVSIHHYDSSWLNKNNK